MVGRPTGAAKVVVERGPVTKFADAVHNDSPVYQSADAARAAGFAAIPAPPTYAFSRSRTGASTRRTSPRTRAAARTR